MELKATFDTADVMVEVLDSVWDKLESKLARYEACGCAACQVEARQLQHWLSGRIEPRIERRSCSSEPAPEQGLWQCPSCLRDIPTALVACPYCGAGRFLAY